MQPLIDATTLAAELDSARPPIVLDVRWRLVGPSGHEAYLDGHIPGAVYVDLESELTAHGAASDGRHPAAAFETVQTAARRWGIDDDSRVVVTDDGGMLAASRAWWELRRAGFADVRVLDGSFAAWRAAGLPVATDDVVPRPGTVTLDATNPLGVRIIDIDAAERWPSAGVLIDARAPERFRGETEPFDPVAGHVPGAVNLPSAALFSADGTFLPADGLAAALDAVGATRDVAVAAYCGSGITAAQIALAAAVAGRDVSVFPGSWSAWSNTAGRPVATGA